MSAYCNTATNKSVFIKLQDYVLFSLLLAIIFNIVIKMLPFNLLIYAFYIPLCDLGLSFALYWLIEKRKTMIDKKGYLGVYVCPDF